MTAPPPPFPAAVVEAYTAAGLWGTETVSELVSGRAATAPGALAFAADDGELTWAAYDRAADDLAAQLLDAGLAPGGLVGAFLPDLALTHVTYLALERLGSTTVGIGPRSGPREVEHILSTTGAHALLTQPTAHGQDVVELGDRLRSRLPALEAHLLLDPTGTAGQVRVERRGAASATGADRPPRPPRPLGPNDLYLVNATSGTTGVPKCVQHTQNRWLRFAHHAIEAGELGGDDVVMSVLPTPFGFGLWSSHLVPLLLGAPTVLLERWDAAVALRLLRDRHVTTFAGVTTQLMMLLEAIERNPQPLDDLRVVFTGGEAVPYERSRRFEELTGARVLQFYGSNESGALSCTTLADDEDHRLRTAGRVLAEMDVRLVVPGTDEPITTPGEPGQPTCKGPLLSPGYYGDPSANAALFDADGRLRMGDLATLSEDGYLTVVGRVADIIIRGGTNISATQVEAAVAAHPAVELAAVVGGPDPTFGERVWAFVVLRPAADLSLEQLHGHLRDQGLARYNWPEHLEVVDEMPISAGEKVAKAELRRRASLKG